MIQGLDRHRTTCVLALSALVLSCDSGTTSASDGGAMPDAPVVDVPAADTAPAVDLGAWDTSTAPDVSPIDVTPADVFVPECTGVGACAPGATQPCPGGGSQTCSSSCTWSACPSCAANACRDHGHSSGDHCDGNARVSCATGAEGCSIESSRVSCPYGCLDGACLLCGDLRQACCTGSVCHTPGTLVCSAGSCAHCGSSGEPCCTTGAPCGGALACTAGYCQPDMNSLWSEDFEAIAWDHNGGGTLSDGITLFDAGGPTLRTAIAPGNGSARALGWYGGGVVAPRTVAGMTIPAVFGTTRTLTVEFDAFASIDFDPIIILTSPSCGTTYNVTVRRMYGWQRLSRDFPACSSMGRIVFQVGDIYEAPTGAVALRIDNIHLTYH